MQINDDTNEFISRASRGLFPQKSKHFYVQHKGTDKSYRNDVFKCIASDSILVVSKSITDKNSDYINRFPRSEWTFIQVSEEVLNALGVCIAKEDVADAEIIKDLI